MRVLTKTERLKLFLWPGKDGARAGIDIYYCAIGAHWIDKELVEYSPSGRELCPLHHQLLRRKKKILLPEQTLTLSTHQ